MPSPLDILKQRYGQMRNQPVTQEEQDRAAELQRLGALLQGLNAGAAQAANVEAPKTDFSSFGNILQNQLANKQRAYESEMGLNQSLFNQDRQNLLDEQNLKLNQLKQASMEKELKQPVETQAQRDARELQQYKAKKQIDLATNPAYAIPKQPVSDADAVRLRIQNLNDQRKIEQGRGNQAGVASIDSELNKIQERQRMEQNLELYNQQIAANPNDTKAKQAKAILEKRLRDLGPALNLERVGALGKLEAPIYEKAKLMPKEVTEVTNFDQSLDALGRIAAEKPSQDTGPVSAFQNTIAQKLGIDDPQKSAFKAQVNDQVANYIKSISGAAASDREREFLMQNLPKVDDNDATFNAKLNAIKTKISQLRERYLSNLQKAGRDISNFNLNTSNTETVRMQDSNGNFFNIPASEVNDAKKDGLRVVP